MKQLKLRTSILIASIYAAVFFAVMKFLNKVVWTFGPLYGDAAETYQVWRAWTPMILGMIAILLFGFLIYITDWKNGLKD